MRTAAWVLVGTALVGLWADAGADLPCVLESKTCVDGPSTKIIGGVSVYEDCWKYTLNYKCGGITALSPDCSTLLAQGCYQIGSSCSVNASDGTCDIYTQNYECKAPDTTQTVMTCGPDTFCLQGTCTNTAYAPNTGFTKSYGSLAALEEAGRELDPNNLTVFKGVALQCTQYIANSYDCCDFNGILNGILSCSPDEVLLAQQYQAGNTVYVGSYCSSSLPLIGCVETKETYCDFKSLLARIIQQQGRPQLGLTFGSAQNPDCSGLTITQFSSINFNLIDFSEFINKFAVPSADTAAAIQKLQNKLNSGSN
jgi:conjugal transfer mating pair stabilization protein TraN